MPRRLRRRNGGSIACGYWSIGRVGYIGHRSPFKLEASGWEAMDTASILKTSQVAVYTANVCFSLQKRSHGLANRLKSKY